MANAAISYNIRCTVLRYLNPSGLQRAREALGGGGGGRGDNIYNLI